MKQWTLSNLICVTRSGVMTLWRWIYKPSQPRTPLYLSVKYMILYLPTQRKLQTCICPPLLHTLILKSEHTQFPHSKHQTTNYLPTLVLKPLNPQSPKHHKISTSITQPSTYLSRCVNTTKSNAEPATTLLDNTTGSSARPRWNGNARR